MTSASQPSPLRSTFRPCQVTALISTSSLCRAGVHRLAAGGALQPPFTHGNGEIREHELADVKRVEQFAEPVAQQRVEIVRCERDANFFLRPHRLQIAGHDREHGPCRFGEKRVEVRGANPQSHVGRVIECLVHGCSGARERGAGSGERGAGSGERERGAGSVERERELPERRKLVPACMAPCSRLPAPYFIPISAIKI